MDNEFNVHNLGRDVHIAGRDVSLSSGRVNESATEKFRLLLLLLCTTSSTEVKKCIAVYAFQFCLYPEEDISAVSGVK
jgi:hypothetical protein